ncbi:MAG: hypothetical protein DMG57_42085 [Acidobacteria bacterium]|nr:MAG: hypothetical protein DMG57_42085 [Acidobacteriota bacterium]
MSSRRCAAGICAIFVLVTARGGEVDKDTASVLARRHYWVFQKPVKSAVPSIQSIWIKNPIDAFILEGLREKHLTPSKLLDRKHLIRRVTFDLTGLPPQPGEIDFFLRDRRANAYEILVDRLLASPHYGERWALKWLDVVRYADTNGYEADGERVQAWRYRDYVAHAFNSEKPYDRFVKEQIAGDELWPANQEALIATGFHRMGPIHIVGGNQDEEANRQEVLVEMTGAIGSTFMGLTVGCARCHNHKFDPILQSDYYGLQAIFASTELKDVDVATAEQKAASERETKDYEARLDPLKKEIAEIEKPARAMLREKKLAQLDPKLREALDIPKDKRTAEQKVLAKDAEEQIDPLWNEVMDALSPAERDRRAALRQKLHEVELTAPDPAPAAFAVSDVTDKPVPPTYILRVGDVKHRIRQVEPGVITVLNTGNTEVPQTASGRRAALANWLASPDNPLTARVMVNRIWQLRMGTGIVVTPNDFGVLGERPSNQKLLDGLAVEFVERGWSVKAIDRMIMLSSAYQQLSAADPVKTGIDPDNKLYWRMNRKRLEAELVRDSVLAVSGDLNPRLGGKPIRVPIDREVYDLIFTEGERDGLWPVTPGENEQHRRSLYLLNKRTVRLPLMMAFDQPDTMTSCPARPVSIHALQALSLFNSDFMRGESNRFAARLERECEHDHGCELRRAYKLALARTPRSTEMKMGREFLAGGGNLADFCLAMMNRNEFVYVP